MEKADHIPQYLIGELTVISSWNIEARYQDYKDRFYKMCTSEYTNQKLRIVKELVECMTKAL